MAKRRSNNMQSYLFNFAAIGVGASTALLAIFGMRSKVMEVPCSERYGIATQFSLQRGAGEPASAAELQARLGGRDWGVGENASVVKTPEGPGLLALHVNLPQPTTKSGRSGLGFTWLLANTQPAQAACLSYQVMVPNDFEYGDGGILPGLFGGATTAPPQDGKDQVSSSFGTHILWARDGRLSLRMALASDTGGADFKHLGPVAPQLERGRWVPIEQEIKLNTDDMNDGLMRVWVDGQLKLEMLNVAWRANEVSMFRGVDVRAHFAHGTLEAVRPPLATSIRLSPIEARWQ
jgi:hypothetical protein